VIGVLDVHSTQPSAFNQDDLEILQVLADQVALAIDSARSLQESRRALQELNTLYGQETLKDWQKRLGLRKMAFRYNRLAVENLEESQAGSQVGSAQRGNQLEVPITLRGQSLGSLILRREPDQLKWTEEDLALAVDAIAQVAPALEYGRLLEEIEQRAQMESIISQISASVQGSLDLESVVRAIVQEVGRVINASRVRFRFTHSVEDVEAQHGGPPHEN